MGASPRDLVIVGSGGLAREVAEAIRDINAVRPTWSLRGFVDDDRELHGSLVAGLPVLGAIELVREMPEAAVVIATGRPDNYVSRRLIANRLELPEDRCPPIVHPTANVGSTCTVGPGSIVLGHTDLTADVVLGRHAAIMPQVVLPHDTTVEDFVTLAAGVRVGGACRLSEGAYVGSGAVLLQALTVGSWAMVGMGSVVTRDVPSERLWRGVPARDAGRAPLPSRPTADPAARGPESR